MSYFIQEFCFISALFTDLMERTCQPPLVYAPGDEQRQQGIAIKPRKNTHECTKEEINLKTNKA